VARRLAHQDVTHANFGSDPVSRRVIYDSMPVADVSPELQADPTTHRP